MGSIGGWLAASTWGLLLPLFTVILVGGPITQPTDSPPVFVPSVPHGGNGGLEDPVDVEVRFASAPRIGIPSSAVIEFTSNWDDLGDVHAHLEASEDLLLIPEGAAPSTLVPGHERTWRLSVVPMKEGFHRVAVRVTGLSAIYGSVGGLAVLTLELPLMGPGEIYVGQPPVLSPRGRADTIAEPSFDLALDPGSWKSPLPAGDTGVPLPSARVDPPPPQPQSHGTFNVTVRWNYWLEDDVNTAPQRWMTVEVWDEDAVDDDDLLATGMTDEGGNFTSLNLPRAEEAGQGNQDVYVRFVACSTVVCVRTTNGTAYSWRTETVTVATEDAIDFGARASSTNEFAQRPFQYINNAWDYAVNQGGLGPVLGQVRVLIPDACTFYTRSDDTIHLCADGVDDKSPDDVGHEYAHYVQEKMYGDSFWPSPGGPHGVCEEGQQPGLAWTEGFADFFGPRAHQSIVDPRDHFYSRPWDGSLFSLDLEIFRNCPTSVRGDRNELRIAMALWDLSDSDDDFLDVGISHPAATLLRAINGCNQSTYRAFFDGGRCNWLDGGNPRFDFLATALQNTIDYNLEPIAQVTSQTAFAWVSGTLPVAAEASDSDSNVTEVVFSASTSSSCALLALPLTIDEAPPFSAILNISPLPDANEYWVCARAADELEAGAWSASSSSFGIDTMPPVSTAVVRGILGVEGWYSFPVSVELQATDAGSGVTSISYRLDDAEVRTYAGPFRVEGDGIHTVAFFAVDIVGNVENVQPLLVLIDTGPPIIQILQPTPGAYVGQSAVSLAWSVTDSGAGVEACAVRLDEGAPALVEGDPAFTFRNVPDGPHGAAVTCVDRVGRVSEVEVPFTVDTNPFSLTGPVGPTLDMAIAGLVILFVALLLRRRRR